MRAGAHLTVKSASMDAIYRAYAREISRAIFKHFGAGPPEPDDVMHAAFARYAQLADPGAVKNPRAFLHTTARNIVLDHKRAGARMNAFVDTVLQEAGESLGGFSPEDVLIHKEQFAIMVSVLKCLPKKQRVVLTMNRLHHKSYAQIARETGWSTSDIGRQLQAGLKAIDDAIRRANGYNRRRARDDG